MPWTGWRKGFLLIGFFLALLFTAVAVEAKDPLTFKKIVIAEDGKVTTPIEISGEEDLKNAGLDSIRLQVPAQDDLGTAYKLILYPTTSDTAFEVTYYASRSGDRGYIHQEEAVSLGGGTLHPGWNRPSQELELTLRKYGAVNLTAHSDGFQVELWQTILVPVGVLAFALIGGVALWRMRRTSPKTA